MRILLTGVTGFIGAHLARHALDAGHEVAGLVREQYAGQPLPPSLAPFRSQLVLHYADLRNYPLARRAVAAAAPEAVVHLAAAGVTDPFLALDSALRHNLTGTLNLARACCEANRLVGPLVVARTPGELTAMNVYAASKAAAWSFCQMYARTQQWPIVGAMIHQCYGPGQPSESVIPAAFRAALRDEDFPMTAGTQERDWIYVDDVARGLLATVEAAVSPGETAHLATGRLTSVAEVVTRIYALTGSRGRPRPGLLRERPGEERQQAAMPDGRPAGWQAMVTLEAGLERLLTLLRS